MRAKGGRMSMKPNTLIVPLREAPAPSEHPPPTSWSRAEKLCFKKPKRSCGYWRTIWSTRVSKSAYLLPGKWCTSCIITGCFCPCFIACRFARPKASRWNSSSHCWESRARTTKNGCAKISSLAIIRRPLLHWNSGREAYNRSPNMPGTAASTPSSPAGSPSLSTGNGRRLWPRRSVGVIQSAAEAILSAFTYEQYFQKIECAQNSLHLTHLHSPANPRRAQGRLALLSFIPKIKRAIQVMTLCAPKGTRTPVWALRGPRPGPLDDGGVYFIGGRDCIIAILNRQQAYSQSHGRERHAIRRVHACQW